MRPLRDLLRTELPIVRAPMAGSQGSALAIAVSNAGGMGSLPCAMLDATQMRAELAAIRAGTDRPFNVNFFSRRPARGIVNRLMAELGPLRPQAPEFPLASAALAPLRAAAEALGLGDFSPLWAGQNLEGCREAPAAEVTRGLMG